MILKLTMNFSAFGNFNFLVIILREFTDFLDLIFKIQLTSYWRITAASSDQFKMWNNLAKYQSICVLYMINTNELSTRFPAFWNQWPVQKSNAADQ